MLTHVKAPKVFLCSREGLTGGRGRGGGGGGEGEEVGGGEVFPDQITQFTHVCGCRTSFIIIVDSAPLTLSLTVWTLHPLGVVSRGWGGARVSCCNYLHNTQLHMFWLFAFFRGFLLLTFVRGISESRHQRIWNQHKILRFFDTHLDIFQEKMFWGHNSTFCIL